MALDTNEAKFVISFALFHTKLLKKIDNQLGYHGISFTEFLIMHQLEHAKNKTMRRIELAESIGISASGVTRLLAPMEKINLVAKESNARDARVSLVRLTKAGENVYKESGLSFEHTAQSILEPLNENQLDKLVELTNKIM